MSGKVTGQEDRRRRLTNEDLAGLIDRNHADTQRQFDQLREQVSGHDADLLDLKAWRDGRAGAVRKEIEEYHQSPEFALVMAEFVVPAMKVAVRSAISWKRVMAAMGALALTFNLINAGFTALRNLS